MLQPIRSSIPLASEANESWTSVPPSVKLLGELGLTISRAAKTMSDKNNYTAGNLVKMISDPFRSFHHGLLLLVYHNSTLLTFVEKMLPKHQILGVYPCMPHG